MSNYITQKQFNEWKKSAYKHYGSNPLDWPKHLRDALKALTVVKEEPIKPVQEALPLGNTGVNRNDYQ